MSEDFGENDEFKAQIAALEDELACTEQEISNWEDEYEELRKYNEELILKLSEVESLAKRLARWMGPKLLDRAGMYEEVKAMGWDLEEEDE